MSRWILIGMLSWLAQNAFATQSQLPDKKKAPALPQLEVSEVAIAGISSGAYLAVQYQMAYPEDVVGVGSLAGGLWNCSQGDWQRARKVCMAEPESIVVEDALQLVQQMQQQKQLGNGDLLRAHRVFLFQGTKDSVVSFPAVEKLEKFLQFFKPKIQARTDIPAGHGFPTSKVNNPCDQSKIPWLVNCQYDLSEEMLRWIWGALQPAQVAEKESLYSFDQTAFVGAPAKVAEAGQIYIPQKCLKGGCRAVIMLHGCLMGPSVLGEQFVTGTELNDWAEGNSLVMVYPATIRGLGNPNGCWDWFGYTGKDFLSRQAPQILFLHELIVALRKGSVYRPH